MRRYFLFLFFLMSSVCLFAQDVHKSLDSLFKSYYSKGSPGAAIVIELRGKVIFEQGYGLANISDGRMIDHATHFNIGSLTKQFTAYSILKLELEKRLSLTDKLSQYFPGLDPSIGEKVTIRELLTHSSGIRDHYEFTDTFLVKHATDKDVLEAVRKQHSTLFEPGSQYRYSNTAFCLLGLIIEKASGLYYADYLQKNIFDPLSMNHTKVFSMDMLVSNRALGYDADSSRQYFRILDASQAIFFSTEADGGIYTSLDDYLRWFHALQSGTILDPALVQKLRSAQFPIDPAGRLSYGYGWFVSTLDSVKSVYHTGSNGGFRAIVFTRPEVNDAIVIFSNRDDIDLEKMLEQINQILHISDKSFTKIASLVSFNDSWPNFAPCKKTLLYSILSGKSLNASVMVLN